MGGREDAARSWCAMRERESESEKARGAREGQPEREHTLSHALYCSDSIISRKESPLCDSAMPFSSSCATSSTMHLTFSFKSFRERDKGRGERSERGDRRVGRDREEKRGREFGRER